MSTPEWRGRIQNRKDTAANWESNDPVLLDGEIIVVETSAGEIRHKTGDGSKKYTQLPFDDEVVRNLIATNIGAHNTGADTHSDIRALVTTAQTTADAAQTAAGKAHTAADNAQTTADTAVAAAASAQDTADNAYSLAGSAQSTADGVRTDYDIHAANKNNPHEVTPIQIGAVPQEWIYTNPDDANVQTAIRTSAEYGYIQLNHTTDGGTTNDGTWISCGSLGFNKGSSYRYLCLDDDANFAVEGEWAEDPSGSGNWVCDYYKILHEGNLSDLAGLDIGVSDSTIALLNNETTMGSSILDINDSTVIFRGSVATDAEGNTTRTTGVSFDTVDISIFESDMVVDSAYAAINNTYFDIGDSSLNMVGNDIAIGNGAINIVECAVTIDNKPVLTSGFSAGTEAPSNTNLLWIDTGNSNVMKFYNGSAWVAIGAVWSA